MNRASEFIEMTIPNNSASVGSSYKEGLHFHTQEPDVQLTIQEENRRTVVDVGYLIEASSRVYIMPPASNSKKPAQVLNLGSSPSSVLHDVMLS